MGRISSLIRVAGRWRLVRRTTRDASIRDGCQSTATALWRTILVRKRKLRMADKRKISSPRRKTIVRSRAGAAVPRKREAVPKTETPPTAAKPPWMTIPEPRTRALKVYALDPSAGQYIGNVMTVRIRWERNLRPGPIGRRFAVIDYDAANRCYYPPVDLDDPRLLAECGLDPSESDPRFHQQMVYAVASETVEKFEAALGRTIHWRRAERPPGDAAQGPDSVHTADDIWVLKLFPHAMAQANAFYSRDAHGILFGYFRAAEGGTDPGRNLPGQRIFTCLSHDIIAHEVTHAVIDGIRAFFTEPTNPDVLAFHEAFADLTALFLHFSHKDALRDTIRRTGGRLHASELAPDAAGVGTPGARAATRERARITDEIRARNPLIELAQQFGEASGMGRGLRGALDIPPDPKAMRIRVDDAHFRGSILVAAVFDAYFSTYLRAAAPLFRICRAGGGDLESFELPAPLADALADAASKAADEFFQLCARALDYCPPVDVTFGDYLRALVTASTDLRPEQRDVRQALMQSFRARGILPDSASFFSEDALVWPRVPDWTHDPVPDALPPVVATIADPRTGVVATRELAFGHPDGLTKDEKDVNGAILRHYARENAARLGFDADPQLAPSAQPYPASFHTVFRVTTDGRLRIDMVIELVQTRRVPFDADSPEAGSFPLRAGATLIVAAPAREADGVYGPPRVRFSIAKRITGDEGSAREARQRAYAMTRGLMNGDTGDDRHFQVDFGLVHLGM
jgi:hypothetical protein